jgi:hypothetical protein
MAGIICCALGKVKQDWKSILSAEQILAVCQAVGHCWRERLFGPVETVQLFLLQVLHGNTALTHLSHLWGSFVGASAFCEARKRLPLAVWQLLLEVVSEKLADSTQTLWHGLRVWIADGSSFSMPDTPELARHFGYPTGQRKGCGFPVAHLMALMDMATGLVRHVHAQPVYRNDMPCMPRIHNWLGKGDLLLADRGLCSFAHLAVLLQKGIHAVFRMHGSQRVDFTPGRPHSSWYIRRRSQESSRSKQQPGQRSRNLLPTSKWVKSLGPWDQIVVWFKPKECPDLLTPKEYAALPAELTVRELRYRVDVPGFRVREVTLVTTLLDADAFPPGELQKLYAWRWRIETNFRHLKTTMGLEALKCKTVDGVHKELATFALVYNMVRMVMHTAARHHELPVDRISFVDAQRWLASGGLIPLEELVINPDRPNRIEPRMLKRRQKNYRRMTRPREDISKYIMSHNV